MLGAVTAIRIQSLAYEYRQIAKPVSLSPNNPPNRRAQEAPPFRDGEECALRVLDNRPLIVYTRRVKLIVQLKLLPSPKDAHALLVTLERANAAANTISQTAWETHTFGQYALQKAVYYEIKTRFDLTAQLVVRVIAKVADAYKLDRERPRVFRQHGSIAYDDRILRYGTDRVSIWTVEGRKQVPFVCDERARRLLEHRQGESDLVWRDGTFYLFATVNYEEPPEGEVEEVLGIDLGIVNLAVDSDGTRHSSAHVNSLRARHRRLRRRLQTKRTWSKLRLLKKRRRKERRFATWVNHNLSQRIVAEARRTKRAIALEDLHGIRSRVRARKPQRATLSSWSFYQLRAFLEYKAKLAGVRVILVDPRNTSRTCPACGHCAKENRPDQATFLCQSCGLAGLADYIAALNIRVRGWAVVSRPHADAVRSASHPRREPMPPASAER
jgi:putative transposase